MTTQLPEEHLPEPDVTVTRTEAGRMTKISIETKTPGKWRFWDLKTDQVWMWVDDRFVQDPSAKVVPGANRDAHPEGESADDA